MEIKKVKKKKEVEISVINATYTQKDIERLVRADLEAQGYIVESIVIDTGYHYVDDEQGMKRINTFFKNVTATIS